MSYLRYLNDPCNDVKTPDFKVSTEWYQVENGVKWGRHGSIEDDYFWTTPEEREEYPKIVMKGWKPKKF